LESRRVIDLLKGIEAKALALHNQPMPATVMEIDETSISINLPMERPLFRRSVQIPIDSVEMAEGYDDLDISSLVGQVYVDVERLRQSVFRSLGRYGQIGLREVVAESPLENGLAELLSYLSLADGDLAVVFEADAREQMWWNAGDVHRVAEMPRVTFACGSGEGQ